MGPINFIRDVPDFPKKVIIFKNNNTLPRDKGAFKYMLDSLTEKQLLYII